MRILVRRTSGHGDVLSLTSVIPGLQKKYPGAEIYFLTTRGFDQLIRHDPRISGILWHGRPRPFEFDLTFRVDHASRWNITIEGKRIWMPLAQCQMAGVEFSPPEMFLLPEELEAVESSDILMANKYPLGGRSYKRMNELAALLVREGKYCIRQIDNGPLLCRGVDDPKLTIREAAAEVARTRCLITIDSVFLHVGIALGRSMVTIFNQTQRTSAEMQYIPDCWVADWHCNPRRILLMVRHILGDGPPPSDEQHTFGPAYRRSQL